MTHESTTGRNDAPEPPRATHRDTANDQLKRGWNDRLWGSMIAAVLIHFAVLQGWPTMTAADVSFAGEVLETITVPEVEIPPAPESIRRPAAPVVGEGPVPDDMTMPTFEWDALPETPPPPPSSSGESSGGQSAFSPFTVSPAIINRAEVARALDREYPQFLKDAGIEGTVRVGFHIDEEGRVIESRLVTPSGHDGLDEAALAVADVMRFSPALNRETRVAVWVELPISFEVR